VPLQFIRLIHRKTPFQIGYAMYWPLNFNLAVDCDRFSRRHNLPLFDQFPTKLSIPDNKNYIYFMQGVYLFLLVQLREFKANFLEGEFDFIVNDLAMMQNLCMYLGFVFDNATVKKID